MANVIVPNAKNVTPTGQESRMECWLACYAMLLQQTDPGYTTSTVETRLSDGGFTGVAECKANGLDDSKFPETAAALGLGTMLPGCLLSISGVRNKLHSYGALWLAAKLESKGTRWPHIILILGVNEDRNQAYIVNPWKQSAYDLPSKAWVDWQWVRDGIFYGTESVDAGCQYLQR